MRNNQEIHVTDFGMTRFMMSLDESVSLVLFALKNGNQGELFVQKAPSATIQTLISALELILNVKAKTKLIGFRHGEKMHETLLSSDEAKRSVDMENYYRVRPDNRGLNYSISNYNENQTQVEEFNSFNTKLLSTSELAEVLLQQEFVKEML